MTSLIRLLPIITATLIPAVLILLRRANVTSPVLTASVIALVTLTIVCLAVSVKYGAGERAT